MRRLLVSVALLPPAALLAACERPSGDAVAPTIPLTPIETAAPVPTSGAEVTGPVETVEPVVTTGPTSSGDGSAPACAVILELEGLDDRYDYADLFDPALGPPIWAEMFGLVDQLEAAAPAELAPSVATIDAVNHAWYDALVAADWDPMETDISMVDAPESVAAGAALDAYAADVCGIAIAPAD